MIEITIFYTWVAIMGIVAVLVAWGILAITVTTVFEIARDIKKLWGNRPMGRYRRRVMEHLNQLLAKRGNHV